MTLRSGSGAERNVGTATITAIYTGLSVAGSEIVVTTMATIKPTTTTTTTTTTTVAQPFCFLVTAVMEQQRTGVLDDEHQMMNDALRQMILDLSNSVDCVMDLLERKLINRMERLETRVDNLHVAFRDVCTSLGVQTHLDTDERLNEDLRLIRDSSSDSLVVPNPTDETYSSLIAYPAPRPYEQWIRISDYRERVHTAFKEITRHRFGDVEVTLDNIGPIMDHFMGETYHKGSLFSKSSIAKSFDMSGPRFSEISNNNWRSNIYSIFLHVRKLVESTNRVLRLTV